MASASSGGPDSQSEHPPDIQAVRRMVDALCELGCLQAASERADFALTLGTYLEQRVDVSGVRLRDDARKLVNAALSRPDGVSVLVSVIGIFEGEETADGFQGLFVPFRPRSPASGFQGPVSRYDESAALALLDAVKGEMSPERLRDALAVELGSVELPLNASCDQLFRHVMQLNVQPDQMPPAVLLIEQAASQVASPHHRAALEGWARAWAEHAGLLPALERRRAERIDHTYDPEVPRCLLVAVEPARDESGDIVVRPWLNTVAGYWNPQPAEPVTTTMDKLSAAVARALRQGIRLWRGGREGASTGVGQQPPYVEFILPYDLLNHDVAGLALVSGSQSVPLGMEFAVHLRSLDRMRSDDELVRERWRLRWSALRRQGISVHDWSSAEPEALQAWQLDLAGEPGHTAVVLDAPDKGAALEALKTAIASGIGLAVWDRRGVFLTERREVVTAVFATAQTSAQIPMAIHRLRRKAVQGGDQGTLLLGRNIAFLWDDPNRVVDLQAIDYGDPADEEASA
ncbi:MULTISPECIES: hypothetical protein [unclassified Streptomyces]|uniref:VMAP-C domain-containing protein n=1 Tax=unclassified Streptomyces TaxID=2593676 RepID=UPI001928B23D|nr:hypothetical protein [Streptomyces sp. HmicA12]